MPKVYNGPLNKMFDISGKKAAIFGGAGGFGKAIAEGFAANGCDVLILSRREEALKAAVEEIKEVAAEGVVVKYYACDAGVEEQVIAARDYMVSEEGLGGCDILVNTQGLNKKAFSWEIDSEYWDKMLQTNVTSTMYTNRHFGNWMKEHNVEDGKTYDSAEFEHGKPSPCEGYGKIINMSSVRGIRIIGNGGMGNIGYCTTKGAVEMLTKAMAADLRPNIQVNAIGPNITYTPMMVGMLPPDEETRNKIADSLPARRIGYEIDVVGVALFLASPASDMITATTLYPDGGLVATS